MFIISRVSSLVLLVLLVYIRSVAVAFVTDSTTWKASMRHCVQEDGRFLTPMRMLIESMPGTYIHSYIISRSVVHYFSCTMLHNTVGLFRFMFHVYKQNIDLLNACFYAQHWTDIFVW